MARECFDLLSQRIIISIGESQLKSEAYVDALLKGKDSMYDANEIIICGFIVGEVKLGIILCLLAGGDALDLGIVIDIHSTTCHHILHDVLLHWIIKMDIGNINMIKHLRNDDAMACVSAGFSYMYKGVLKCAIIAIDGWLVCIVIPSFCVNGIKNIDSFFSRKEFYGLNFQYILDDKKIVIWFPSMRKAGFHYAKLHKEKEHLYSLECLILGDSAYTL